MPSIFTRKPLVRLSSFPLAAEAVSTLHGATEFRRCLLQRIGQARRRIYLVALYLQHDEAGIEILHALHAAKAVQPELEIAVLVDWHRAQRGLIGAGKQAGNAAWYQQETHAHASEVPVYGVPVQSRELFGVLHLKGFVIDDCVIYSGASLNNVYLHKLDKYRHDRYHLLHSSVLADCMAVFIQQHILASPAVHRLDRSGIPPTRSIRREIREFRNRLKLARYDAAGGRGDHSGLSVTPLIGVGKNNPLSRQITELIASSREHLIICTPYFNFPLGLMREIKRVLKRGVRVDIIVGDKTANDFFIAPSEPFKVIGALPYLYEANLRRFAKTHQAAMDTGQLNLHLWKDGDNSYHLKGVWVDRHSTLLTGNNLNPRAFRLDLENALLIHDPGQELAQQREAELDSIFLHTVRLSHFQELETLKNYPEAVRKLLNRLGQTGIDRLLYRVL
jgi:CDP-diacylglycerol---serine O-phosphatidyltransferase